MSQKLEEAFRSSLQNKEEAYDPKAWEQLSARLDQTMPISPKGSAANWWIAAVSVGVIGISSAVYFSMDAEKSLSQAEEKTSAINSTVNTAENKTSPIAIRKNESNQLEGQKNIESKTSTKAETKATIESNKPETHQTLDGSLNQASNNNDEAQNDMEQSTNPIKLESIEFPKIGTQCQGEEISIENNNRVDLTLVTPSGKKVIVRNKSSKKVTLNETGTYTLQGDSKTSTFFATQIVKSDFDLSGENEFVNGVPTINVASINPVGNQSWFVKGTNLKYTGNDAQIHLFEEGKYEIVLTTSKNGCDYSVSKMVSVEENYNLLAPSGFRPMDSDPRTKTFMPFALKERKTPFQLIIIDPRDGHILFQSNDENLGWDGFDKKTGKLASEATTYLWKVNLEKPLKGEKKNYSGSVTIVY